MPTIKDIAGPYRFFFYSFDCNEPKHIHVQSEKSVCKYWLDPLVLGKNYGFASKDLKAIRKNIQLNMAIILEAWNEHCG